MTCLENYIKLILKEELDKQHTKLLTEAFLEPPPVLAQEIINWIIGNYAFNANKYYENKLKQLKTQQANIDAEGQKILAQLPQIKANIVTLFKQKQAEYKSKPEESWKLRLMLPTWNETGFNWKDYVDVEHNFYKDDINLEAGIDDHYYSFSFSNGDIGEDTFTDPREVLAVITNYIHEHVPVKFENYKEELNYRLQDLEEVNAHALQIMKQYPKKTNVYRPDGYGNNFALNLTGWKYTNIANNPKAAELSKKVLFVVLSFNENGFETHPTDGDYRGIYRSYKLNDKHFATIEVWTSSIFPNSISDFNDAINQVKITTNHELIHFTQDLISEISGEQKAGYPSKTITKGKESDNTAWDEVPHGLRGIEFYTRLNDAFAKIQSRIENLKDINQRTEYAKEILGIEDKRPAYAKRFSSNMDSWLSTLQEKNPLKWKKAVKEIWKLLQEKGLVN